MPSYFLYKLVPPRPSFGLDMDEVEAAKMAEHGAYWDGHFEAGRVVLFGPVLDPAGVWGMGIVEADDEAAVRAIGDADPAVTSGMCTYEVHSILDPSVR